MLQRCRDNPEAIPDLPTFYAVCLTETLSELIRENDVELADEVARLFESGGSKHLPTQLQRDEVDFVIGHFRLKLHRYDEAIRAFERIGTRQVSVPADELWGKSGFLSGSRAAEICRQLMRADQTANAPGVGERQPTRLA